MPLRLQLALFLSGASGLGYQLLWTRALTRTLGGTTASFAAVLAAFFIGLALGAELSGHRSGRARRPLRGYAALELAIAGSALALQFVLPRLPGLLVSLDVGDGALVRFAVAFALLGLPTTLMGATLPLVAQATSSTRSGLSRVYAVNTAGAAAGVYLVVFVLLPALGSSTSQLVLAGGNLLAAALAATATGAEPKPSAPRTAGRPAGHLVAAAFASGFGVVAQEVVLSRILSLVLEGTIYGLHAVLFAVLVGGGAGAALVSWLRPSRPAAGYIGLQALAVVSVVVASRWGVEGATHLRALTSPAARLGWVTIGLLIPATASGAAYGLLLQLAHDPARPAGRSLGRVFAASTIGSVAGATLTGLVLVPTWGTAAALTSSLGLVAASAVLIASRSPGVGRGAIASIALAFAAIGAQGDFGLSALATPADTRAVTGAPAELRFLAEGRTSVVSVIEVGGAHQLAVDGLRQGSRAAAPPHPNLDSVFAAAIPRGHAAEAARALVVGLGAGVTAELLAADGVEAVRVVELEARVVEAVAHMPGGQAVLRNDRITVEIGDARRALMLDARAGRTYDLVTSMPAHPWVSPALFTEEYFGLAKAVLSERGVFCTWFGVGRLDRVSAQSLVRSFVAVFDAYAVYWMPEVDAYYLVGAAAPLHLEPADRGRAAPWRDYPMLADPHYLAAHVQASGGPEAAPLPEGPRNTDDAALVELRAPYNRIQDRATLDGFFTTEYLAPSMIDAPARRAFFFELVEHLLGTPGGRLPTGPRPADLGRAQRTIEAVGFPEPERRYFEARLALAAQDRDVGYGQLAELSETPGRVGVRARRFLALRHPPGSPERLAALAALDTESVESLLDRGRRALEQGELRSAENLLTRALQRAPARVDVMEALLVVRVRAGRAREVSRLLELLRAAGVDAARIQAVMRSARDRQR